MAQTTTAKEAPAMPITLDSVVRYQPREHAAWIGDVVGFGSLAAGAPGHPTNYPNAQIVQVRVHSLGHTRLLSADVLEVVG